MLHSTTCRSIGSLVLVGMGKLTNMWLIGYREGIRRGQLEGRSVSRPGIVATDSKQQTVKAREKLASPTALERSTDMYICTSY